MHREKDDQSALTTDRNPEPVTNDYRLLTEVEERWWPHS